MKRYRGVVGFISPPRDTEPVELGVIEAPTARRAQELAVQAARERNLFGTVRVFADGEDDAAEPVEELETSAA